MSKVGWWLAVAVALATASAMCIASSDGTAIGTILILGITALVVVWYADATGRMAVSTRELAQSSVRPELVIRCPYEMPPPMPVSGGVKIVDDQWRRDYKHWQFHTRSRVINQGTGPAFDVSFRVDGVEANIAGVLPRGGIAYHPKLSEIAEGASPRQTVTLHYKGGFEKPYSSCWVYDEDIRNWRAEEKTNSTADDTAE